MSPPCSRPIPPEQLTAYWSEDLSPEELDAVEAHLMGCPHCSEASARVAAITTALGAMVPVLVTRVALEELRGRGLRIVEGTLSPGERRPVVFERDVDLLIHRLGGLDLARVERVRFLLRVEETGEVILDDPRAPFERDTGEVLLACQRHFAAFPPNVVAEVRARDPSGAEHVATYVIPHTFESA